MTAPPAPLVYKYSVRTSRQIRVDGLQVGKYSDESVEEKDLKFMTTWCIVDAGQWALDGSMIKAKQTPHFSKDL
jgi:hypothetical protein